MYRKFLYSFRSSISLHFSCTFFLFYLFPSSSQVLSFHQNDILSCFLNWNSYRKLNIFLFLTFFLAKGDGKCKNAWKIQHCKTTNFRWRIFRNEIFSTPSNAVEKWRKKFSLRLKNKRQTREGKLKIVSRVFDFVNMYVLRVFCSTLQIVFLGKWEKNCNTKKYLSFVEHT